MRINLLKIIIALLIILFCSSAVYAEGIEDAARSLGLERVETEPFEDITLGDLTHDILSGGWRWDIGTIFSRGMSVLFSALYGNLMLVAQIFAVGVLSSVLLNLRSSMDSSLADGGFYAAYIIAAGLGVRGIGFAVEYGLTLTNQLDVYIKTLIPVVLSVSVASGAYASGIVIQPLIIGISQTVAYIVTQWLIPALTVTSAMCVINNMSDKADLSKMIMLMQKGIRWFAGILMTLFVGIMTIQCMITPALNSVSGRLAKYAVSNFVPVVGGIISDSISVVAGYCTVLKGAVGGAGIAVGVLLCIKPLAEVAAIAVLYNVTSAVIRPISDKRLSSLLSDLGQTASTLLILLIMMILMFVINVCAAVSIGGFSGAVS